MATTEDVRDNASEFTGEDRDRVRTSVVLPAYNEVNNIEPLIEEIQSVFQTEPTFSPYDIIIVDDGSTDGTRGVIRDLAEHNENVLGLLLSRNFGQSAALNAGIKQATGEFIVTLDADRQNDPQDIPDLLNMLVSGDSESDSYDCVSGWRRDRNDPLTKTIPSAIQTRMARWTGPDIHDFGCTLKAYRSDALAEIELYGEGHRYIPAKLYNRGYRITEIPVNHRPRTEGSSKYGTKRLIRGFVDLLFQVFWNRYSTRPVHFLGGFGLVSFGTGMLIGIHAVLSKYVLGVPLLPNLPRLVLTVALVLFGLILIMFGFLAEMITKLHYIERDPYRVEVVIGGGADNK
ncbi:glycosyltransferase family 2 protein [Haloarcula argentinensis]|uniref:Glycosyltransferase n=1 Tax=Haloarcula argentinensis TaxID=43776 RepID=A0A847UKM8_HALAR|nr:glycosyltransferase family 2 protein [Haloarcula argentinensis]NLV14505.1 glycosyltransferase [Haloarcula argentinensis]